jgi:hypothetical protein
MSYCQPTPVQAAFRVGVLLNRLRFRLEQSNLFMWRALREADRLAAILAREARWLVEQSSRNALEREIRDRYSQLRGWITTTEESLS